MSHSRRSDEERPSDVRQLLVALLATLVSVGMLLGSFLLARLDITRVPATRTQAVVLQLTITPFLPTLTPPESPALPSEEGSPTSPPVEEATATEESVRSATPEPAETPAQPQAAIPMSGCDRPPGWFIYTVREGDALTGLAQRSGTTMTALMVANCLETTALFPGQHIYLPPAFYPTPTPKPYPCGPPRNWDIYTVQRGDTLHALARRFDVDVETLRRANCLQSSAIYARQVLYVPPLPPTTWPTAISTPTSSPSSTPTHSTTPTPSPTEAIPTRTPTSSPTSLPTPTTTSPSPTATQVPTPTPSPVTPTPTSASPTATASLTPKPTTTPTTRLTPTSTVAAPTATEPATAPTWTPFPTQTSTPIPTATPTASPEPPTPTPTPMASPEPPTPTTTSSSTSS